MGQSLSKTKKESPLYKRVLGISDLTTLEEGKKAYIKHFYKNQGKNDMLVEINDAFNLFKSSVNVELYYLIYSQIYNIKAKKIQREIDVTREGEKIKINYEGDAVYFDFVTTTADFFDKLTTAYEVKAPVRFTDVDFERFYRFWGRFSATDKGLENMIRKIVLIIRSKDPRVQTKGDVDVPVRFKTEKKYEKKPKEWKYFCEACKKGFNNENTLKDHRNSKQHKMKSPEGEEVTVGEEVTEGEEVTVESERPKKEVIEEIKTEPNEEKIEGGLVEGVLKKKYIEHKLFRKCGICKEVFETREELISHLREWHKKDIV